ncbi:MAG: NAD(P)H-binding protein [Aquificae bacterium]|nr:NAD(P)H-binding protein [Aquificota bacterium]
MKILISGGTGFVGRYIVNSLCEEHQIYLLARDMNKAQKVVKCKKNVTLIPFVENLSLIVKKSKPDVVINLLGILKEERENSFYKVHVEFTKALVDGAKDIEVKKFIQMSALGADKNSKSVYMRTKALGEEYVINSGLEYAIFRPSIILGKEQKLFYDLKKFSKIAPFFIAPKGKVQPVNIYDVRDCFVKELDSPNSGIFELCGDKVVSYKYLFKFALDYIGVKRPVVEVPKGFLLFLLPFFSFFPEPPMTKDQYYMLQKDNVCSGDFPGVKDILGSVRDAFRFD